MKNCLLFIGFLLTNLILCSEAFVRQIVNESLAAVANTEVPIGYPVGVQGVVWAIPRSISDDGFTLYTSNIVSSETIQFRFDGALPDDLIQLVGLNDSDLCWSKDLFDYQRFPCAILGLNRNTSTGNWISVLKTYYPTKTAIDALPFACSDAMPCSIRTASPSSGVVGGCGGASVTKSSTLVVVTWNNTRYIFRPLQYFGGNGSRIYAIPTGWDQGQLAAMSYDAGLIFAQMPDSQNASCVLNIVFANGTVEVFSIDADDHTSPTGLRRIALVTPTPSVAPSLACVPTAQFVPPPSGISGAIISVTCASGEGWLWELRANETVTSRLVGYFQLPAAPNEEQLHGPAQPLIVDIAAVQIQVASCARNFLLTVALSRTSSVLTPTMPTPSTAARPVWVFAKYSSSVYNSNNSDMPYWLTGQLLSSATIQTNGSYSIGGSTQLLQNGLGWVLPSAIPATGASVPLSSCASVAVSALSWVADMALYSAISADYQFLINSTDGSLARPNRMLSVSGNTLYGGALYPGPARIGNDTQATYTRLSWSPLCTAVLLQHRNDPQQQQQASTLYYLTSFSGMVISPQVTFLSGVTSANTNWAWQPSSSLLDMFLPTLASLKYPIPVDGNALQHGLALVWGDEFPLFIATDAMSQSASFIVGGSPTEFPGYFVDSGAVGPPSGNVEGIPPISAASLPYLFVCIGATVSAYDTNFAAKIWDYSISDGLSCSSGDCVCNANSSLSVSGASQQPITVTTIFFDRALGTYGFVSLVQVTGEPVLELPTNTSLNGSISDWCGPFTTFGVYFDISNSGYGSFMLSVVGTRCFILSTLQFNNDYWSVIVAAGDSSVTFAETIAFAGGFVVLLTDTSTISATGGVRVLAFAFGTLSPNPMAISAANPYKVITGAISFVPVANEGLVIALMADGSTLDQLWFATFDVTTGLIVWNSSLVNLTQVPSGEAQRREALTLFTTQQATFGGIATWACVAVGQLWCITASPTPSKVLEFPWTRNCWGPPTAIQDRYMVYTIEGRQPMSVPLDERDNGWYGLTGDFYPLTINATSCTGAVGANQVLLVLCSNVGEITKRLVLLNTESGRILFTNGPMVVSGFTLSVDGRRLNYIDPSLLAAVTVSIATSSNAVVSPSNFTVCMDDGVHFYSFSVGNGAMANATKASVLDLTETVQSRSYSGSPFLFASTAFTSTYRLSMDAMAAFSNATKLVSAVGEALFRPLAGLMNNSDAFVSVQIPSYINFGDSYVMQASECLVCYLDCHYFCTLDPLTGAQVQYTVRIRTVDAAVKPSGDSEFNIGHVITFPIPYTGSTDLNYERYLTQIPSSEELTACASGPTSVTSFAVTGTYCLTSNTLSWSVLAISEGGFAYLASFMYRKDERTQVPRFYGYVTWSSVPILQVSSSLGLVSFYTNFFKAIPVADIGTIIGVVLMDGVVTINTYNDPSVYASDVCANRNTQAYAAFPVCSETYEVATSVAQTEGIRTVTWAGTLGSNWGVGFISVGYEVSLPSILRSVNTKGRAVSCSDVEDANPLCAMVCQPSATCSTHLNSIFLSYLSLQSWQPNGSSIALKGPCNGYVAGSAAAAFNVKFLVSTNGAVLMTSNNMTSQSPQPGPEVVLFSSLDYDPRVFGVTFAYSHCVYFTLTNVVAQPFSWLAICSIKNLLITLGFYYFASWIGERERKRDARNEEEDRLVSETAKEPMKSREERGLNDNEDKVMLLAKDGHLSRSLLDSVARSLSFLAAFRHPVEKKAHCRRIKENLLPVAYTEKSLAELLVEILGEQPSSSSETVKEFAQFYETEMCMGNWVARRTIPGYHPGSQSLTEALNIQLHIVHDAIRQVYSQFRASRSTSSASLPPRESQTREGSSTHLSASLVDAFSSKEISAEADLWALVSGFDTLRFQYPLCFERASLSSLSINERLRPSELLLSLSLFQSCATILAYAIDVNVRSQSTPLTALQMYECTCFMLINSSLPATILVNSIFHADLGSAMWAPTVAHWIAEVIKSPFLIASLTVLSPPLATHVIPGLVLYCWVWLPPIAALAWIERRLRKVKGSSRRLLAARVVSHILIVLSVSIAFSVAFNVADAFIWKGIKSEEPFPTGSYTRQGYLSALQQDYDSRSLACVWEHLFATVSNFLQMGFFFA